MAHVSISRVEIFTAELPFRFSFGHSLASRRSTQNLLIRVSLSDGSVGYGEGVPRDYVTGETPESALTALTDHLAPLIVGRDVRGMDDLLALLQTVASGVRQNLAAWCAL